MSLIICDQLQKNAETEIELVYFKHPMSASRAVYGLKKQEDGVSYQLFELSKVDHGIESSSLFVGNCVKKDGIFYLLTCMDVQFLLIALLEEQGSRFVPINHLLRVEGYPHYKKLLQCKALALDLIAEVDSADAEYTLVKLDEAKTMQYLLSRVEKITKHLSEVEAAKMETIGSASTFNGVSAVSSITQKDAKNQIRELAAMKEAERVALQIICDYIPARLQEKLVEARNWTLKQVQASEPYKSGQQENVPTTSNEEESGGELTWEEANGYAVQAPSLDHLRFGTRPDRANPPGISISAAASTADSNSSKRLKPSSVALTPAQKKLAQVNKRGVQSISSFFSKRHE